MLICKQTRQCKGSDGIKQARRADVEAVPKGDTPDVQLAYLAVAGNDEHQ